MGEQEYRTEQHSSRPPRRRSSRRRSATPAAVALRLLAVRARSTAELQRRLRERGFTDEQVASELQSLAAQGLVDDTRVAQEYVGGILARKAVGRKFLAAKLRQRGIPNEISERVLQECMPQTLERELARAAAEHKLRALRAGTDGAASHTRTAAVARFLFSRGFSSALVREILGLLFPHASSDAGSPASEHW